MSFEFYTNWWIKSKEELEELTAKDEKFRASGKPIHDRNLANALIGGWYVKYCMLVQDLCACVDQMAQPQRRIAVKKLVDAACIRLNELNDELRKISISEYHYIDGSLVELKLLPYDVEILHPCLFHHRPVYIEDMITRIKDGERIFTLPSPILTASSSIELKPDKTVIFDESHQKAVDIGRKSYEAQPVSERKEVSPGEQQGSADPKERRSSKSEFKARLSRQLAGYQGDLTPEERAKKSREMKVRASIILIQTAERARQERVYFFEKNIIYLRAKEMRQAGFAKKSLTVIKEPEPVVKNSAARKIQTIWKGYRDRQNLKLREDKRRLLIGMTEPSWRSHKEFEIFEANLEKRRRYRDEKIKEYIETIDKEQARILRVVAPGLLEDITDEIREWFHEWYSAIRLFDNFPPEEKGGTILVVRGETFTPKEYIDDYERKRREKVKAGGKDKQKEQQMKEKKKKEEAEKKKKEAEKKKKEAEAKKKKKSKPGEFEYEFSETLSKALRGAGEEEFMKIWNERNPFDNPEDTTYVDLITEKTCYDVQLSVRKEADELMRIELDILQEALARDKGKKYKKKKQKKKKKKGKKKGKKDITADRLTEDLFQELVDNGVIRSYPKVTLDEFKGDFSYNNTELRAHDFDPPAASLDVRQAVTLNCIQPLGVETMKKPRSVLIAGSRQSGRHLLANAVFYHTRSVLFDLSPEVTAGIYPGKKGLAMLIHLVAKMARVLQPSVIYFDGAERIFYKKVPKNEKNLDPKRVGKKLVKGILKTIKPDDRILVLGITSAPWLAQGAKLKKAFDRAILIPRPNYGSVYLWWRELLMPYPGVDRDFNFTSLATATIYQQYPVIKSVVEKVLNPRRIIQLKYKPLRAEELHEVFVSNQIEPMSDKEWKKYVKWYNKTPLGKERAKFNKWADGKRALELKQQEKQRR